MISTAETAAATRICFLLGAAHALRGEMRACTEPADTDKRAGLRNRAERFEQTAGELATRHLSAETRREVADDVRDFGGARLASIVE